MNLYLDLLTTLKVTHAESPIVIFFGSYGIEEKKKEKRQSRQCMLLRCLFVNASYWRL